MLAGDYHWPWSKRNKTGAVEVSTKGLPLWGLKLVGPDDPLFKQMMSEFFGNEPQELIKIATPTCVFLMNGGDRTLVGYDLTYEFLAPDGKATSSEAGGVLMPALMHLPWSAVSEDPMVAIVPGSARLISPLFSIGGLSKGQTIPFVDEAEKKQLKELFGGALKYTLDWTSSLTVSLDGVFFEDGSFVGPDASQFFEVTKAAVDANRDVLEWLASAVRRREQKGENVESVFSELQGMVKDLSQPFKGTPADSYGIHKLRAVEVILRVREKLGAARVVREELKKLESQWPVLRKLDPQHADGRQ
jgi:hypothetical protein